MIYFYLYNDHVDIVKKDGKILTIYFTSDSGKVYYRYKDVFKHPGIFLGVDAYGNPYYLHNHPIGSAHITTEYGFSAGHPIYLDPEKCSNEPLKVIEIGLNNILRGESYKFLTYNCQTYKNMACHSQRKSEDVDKFVELFAVGALTFLGVTFLGAVLSSKK